MSLLTALKHLNTDAPKSRNASYTKAGPGRRPKHGPRIKTVAGFSGKLNFRRTDTRSPQYRRKFEEFRDASSSRQGAFLWHDPFSPEAPGRLTRLWWAIRRFFRRTSP